MGLESLFLALAPLASMVMLQFLEIGLITLSKAAMSKGMSRFILVVYSNALADLILLPSSFIIDRLGYFLQFNSISFLVFGHEHPKHHVINYQVFIFFLLCTCRKKRPPLTFSVLCKFFLLSLAGYAFHCTFATVK